MASSLVSRAWTSAPLAPGPNPGGGAGLALVVELEAWTVDAVVDGASVVAVVASVSAAPVVEARWLFEPLHAASPMAIKLATRANRARLCTAGNAPPSRRGRHTVWRTPPPPHELSAPWAAMDGRPPCGGRPVGAELIRLCRSAEQFSRAAGRGERINVAGRAPPGQSGPGRP